MRYYETGFLVSPNLSEEETENFILQMADIVSRKKGTFIKQDKWGKRKLAYQINKFTEAFYVFFHYEGGAEIPLELERRMRQSDAVLRYLTLKVETGKDTKKKKAEIESQGEETPEPEELAGEEETKEEEKSPEEMKEEVK